MTRQWDNLSASVFGAQAEPDDSGDMRSQAAALCLTSDMLAMIREHAARTYPEECCGLLLGTEDANRKATAMEVLKSENISPGDRTRTYQLAWSTWAEATRISRDRNMKVLGFYHSHPDQPATPSKRDRESAWTGYFYLICGCSPGRAVTETCWRIYSKGCDFERQTLVAR